MTDFLASLGADAAPLTVTGVLLVFFGLVLRGLVKGDLITSRQHDRELAALAESQARELAALKESLERENNDLRGQRDDWRESSRANDARADLVIQQNDRLVEQGRTVVQVLTALQQAVQPRAGDPT